MYRTPIATRSRSASASNAPPPDSESSSSDADVSTGVTIATEVATSVIQVVEVASSNPATHPVDTMEVDRHGLLLHDDDLFSPENLGITSTAPTPVHVSTEMATLSANVASMLTNQSQMMEVILQLLANQGNRPTLESSVPRPVATPEIPLTVSLPASPAPIETAAPELISHERQTPPDIDIQGKLRVKEPDVFSGDRSKCEDFLFAIQNYLDSQDGFFSSVRKQKALVTFLRGDALVWYRLRVAAPGLTFESFDAFVNHFRHCWSEDQEISETSARQRLLDLRQIDTVEEYSTEFYRLVVFTDFDEYSQVAIFKNGLQPDIQQYLIDKSKDFKLGELSQLCIKYDKINRKIKKSTFDPSRLSARPPKSANVHSIQHKGSDKKSRRLDPQERSRRKKLGLCLYCAGDKCPGSSDLNKCPEISSKNVRRQG